MERIDTPLDCSRPKIEYCIFFCILLSAPLFFYSYCSVNVKAMWIVVHFLELCGGIFCFLDIRRRLAFLIFLFCFFYFDSGFFLFNESEVIASLWTTPSFVDLASEATTSIIMYIAIFSVISGYYFFDVLGRSIVKKGNQSHGIIHQRGLSNSIRGIQVIATFLIIVCSFCYVLVAVEKSEFAFHGDYLEYYTSYSTNLMPIIPALANLLLPAFAIYLGTFPSWRKLAPVLLIFLISMFFGMGSGQRNRFAIAILMILFYCVSTGMIKRDWFDKKRVVYSIFVFILVLVALSAVVNIRNGLPALYNLFGGIVSMICPSTSGTVVLDAVIFENAIPEQQYAVGQIVNMINGFFGLSLPAAQTVEYALYGNSLGQTLSYFISPTTFLEGGGIGSCYLAEVYLNYSFFGVIASSGLFGIVLCVTDMAFSELQYNHPYLNACLLLMTIAIWYSGRAEFASFLTSTILSVHFIRALIIISAIRLLFYFLKERHVDQGNIQRAGKELI